MDYFRIVDQFPYVGFNAFSKTSGHGLPPEFRLVPGDLTCLVDQSTRNTCHQTRYLSTWKMSSLLNAEFPKNPPSQRRQTAWESMGQEVLENYLKLLNILFQERRRVEVPSGSASAEVVGSEEQPVEASSSSAPAEVFDVDAEISTLNSAETQAVRIISENPWDLFHAGVLTLRDNKGERVTNPHGEPVLIVREFSCYQRHSRKA